MPNVRKSREIQSWGDSDGAVLSYTWSWVGGCFIICIYDDTLISWFKVSWYMNICTYDDTLIYSGSKDQFLSSKNNITIFRFRIDFACNNYMPMVVLSMNNNYSKNNKNIFKPPQSFFMCQRQLHVSAGVVPLNKATLRY